MQEKRKAFVAYSSRDNAVSSQIEDAVSRANALATPYRFEPWTFNDVPGVPLLSPILEHIEESAFIVADITYLNLNVVYEIGFAIGRQKRVFLIRNKSTDGDKNLANTAGIFDTLGYFEYSGSLDLKDRLTSHVDLTVLPTIQNLDHKAPIYLVEPLTRSEATGLLASRVKKAGYRYRSFNPSEDPRLSATDAIRQVSVSSGVVMLLQSEGVEGSAEHNIRALFVTGLAHGMGKPTLVLNPVGNEPPLDIRDSVKGFRHPDDIREHVTTFCPDVNNYSQQIEPPPIDTGGLLQSLSIGDPTAENEMTTLAHYFLRTDQYQRALRGEVNLVVGRKGSGKTALFIQVRDKTRSDKRNIVVDLKPEGYQLLKLKEEILEYLAEGARQHLITAFWEYLILLEVAYKLLEKDKNTYKYNHEIHELYLELDRAYRVEDFSTNGDFSERLSMLSSRMSQEYKVRHLDDGRKISAEEISNLIYVHDIRLLRTRISEYLEKKESVWILFDNLDKGWSTQGVDVIDATVLRSLIDTGRKIEREMERDGHTFHCLVFVRNDVYEHLMQNSADSGKEMRAILDWTDPDLLQEMMRLRLVSGLDPKASEMSFEQLWRTVCASQVNGEESAAYVLARTLMRPRNFLKIFNHSRGFATNFNHAKIEEDDIEKGLKAYSQDLVIELDRELSDVYPAAKDVLYHFIDARNVISRAGICKIIEEAGVGTADHQRIIDFLLYYGVLGIRVNSQDLFIYNVHYELKPLNIRAARAGDGAEYLVNPAFWPALGITER